MCTVTRKGNKNGISNSDMLKVLEPKNSSDMVLLQKVASASLLTRQVSFPETKRRTVPGYRAKKESGH